MISYLGVCVCVCVEGMNRVHAMTDDADYMYAWHGTNQMRVT